jgi:hypothetical protein
MDVMPGLLSGGKNRRLNALVRELATIISTYVTKEVTREWRKFRKEELYNLHVTQKITPTAVK